VAASVVVCAVQSKRGLDVRRRRMLFYVSAQCMAAVCISTLTGLITYHAFLESYWSYADSHAYANILPSEAAAGYADAGKVVFADEARIDGLRALGFKDGRTYCVAPVRGDSEEPVQFWAAGVDCCGGRGGFTCDDAWDPRARSGLVLINHDRHLQYTLAVRQAKAAFGLASAEEPIFVRWVVDPERVQLNLWRVGFGVLLSACAFFSWYRQPAKLERQKNLRPSWTVPVPERLPPGRIFHCFS